MVQNPELSLILPCYNESEHFSESYRRILKVLDKSRVPFEVIFVEDASQDNTPELISQFIKKEKNKRIRALFHTQNLGRGKSVADGIRAAKGKYVGFIDIDCEVSPVYIPEFLKTLKKNCDVVCAERSYQTTTSGLLRALASKLYQKLVKTVLVTDLSDTEAGYKFFNRKRILPVLTTVKDSGWFWDTEIMVRSQHLGLTIAFIPVQFNRRTDKTSTVRLIPDTISYFIKLFAFRLRLGGNGSTGKT